MTQDELMYNYINSTLESPDPIPDHVARELLSYMQALIYALCREIHDLQVLNNVDTTSTMH